MPAVQIFLVDDRRAQDGPSERGEGKGEIVSRVFRTESICKLYAPAAMAEAKLRGAIVRIGSPTEIEWYGRYE
jgi:hypothetical protein